MLFAMRKLYCIHTEWTNILTVFRITLRSTFIGHFMCYDVPTKIEKGRSAMFVLLDMEWIESRSGHRSLTQLYAARVDEKWNTIRAFDALVCIRATRELRRGASGVQRLRSC